ncbi:MAG: 4-(cytidine 5'-diphospho)-2-C-methyl-D-erythritol kinase [Phycisphaerales bacterium]
MPDTIHLDAPAKVNLALAVGPPRPDGLHPIASWMATVDLCDELLLTRLEEDRLSRYAILWHDDALRRTDIDWSITSDLAVRAHLAVEQTIGRRLPVQLRLDKRIPVGGGLGGGSADAAAMIVGLERLFGLSLDAADRHRIAHELGSDVPFLLDGGSAFVGAVGEVIEPHADTPSIPMVLAFPETTCPTGPVYAEFDTQSPGPLREDAVRRLFTPGSAPAPDALFNDLAPPAMRRHPELMDVAATFAGLAERPAHLSGSGSTLFVVCDDPMHAEYLARATVEQLGLPAVAAITRGGPQPIETASVESGASNAASANDASPGEAS